MKPLVLRDEIHGDVVFSGLIRQIIDHAYFQRLRSIKQVGLAEFVFPCATHTRFQHSLGATHLAHRYFRNFTSSWVQSPLKFDMDSARTRLLTQKTVETVTTVTGDAKSFDFWNTLTCLGALLHDVGHGPWSHTFEQLNLEQDFSSVISKLPETVGEYFAQLKKKKARLHHEDLSILYAFEILRELSLEGGENFVDKYFLAVSLLINKTILQTSRGSFLESALEKNLDQNEIQGGVDFHRLLRPIISGPFDVDRMDYIQRDGRNCGVSMGGIEWNRILNKVLPCLANHSGRSGESKDVVLISNFKNQHVLDDFIFSLFQMYAQVYMHPKIVGFEESIRRALAKAVKQKPSSKVTFEDHKALTDEGFRQFLKTELKTSEVESILLRKPGFEVEVASVPAEGSVQKSLAKQGYECVELQNRPMMKDSLGVFLYGRLSGKKGDNSVFVTPWTSVSPIAKQFYEISYAPKIWLKTK